LSNDIRYFECLDLSKGYTPHSREVKRLRGSVKFPKSRARRKIRFINNGPALLRRKDDTNRHYILSPERDTAVKDEIQGVIFDLDGVLEFQGKAYPEAIELLDSLRRRGIPIRVLSNSTLKSRRSCTEKLRQKGFTVYESEVITASFATARYLETLNPRSCWVMLKREGREEFANFRHDPDNPEYIVLGDFREDFNFQNLNRALRLLCKGAKLIVMITETVDNSLGELELTVGAYGKMLEEAAGIKATYIGKPNRYVFDITLDTMGDIERSKVLMVGDRVETDILGAKNAGLKAALIKTGEFQESDLESPVAVPDYIFDSVSEVRKLFP
jgi:HAD superfamily hydrolase (TIGR01458 family)